MKRFQLYVVVYTCQCMVFQKSRKETYTRDRNL